MAVLGKSIVYCETRVAILHSRYSMLLHGKFLNWWSSKRHLKIDNIQGSGKYLYWLVSFYFSSRTLISFPMELIDFGSFRMNYHDLSQLCPVHHTGLRFSSHGY